MVIWAGADKFFKRPNSLPVETSNLMTSPVPVEDT
jgi:hypothetical protein